MDLFTHFLVPYIILFFAGCKHKLEGAFGGISIDFDFFIIWIGFLFPSLFIFTHRGITHSFVFGFVTAVIFLFIITRNPVQKLIGKVIKRDLNLEFTYKTILLAYFGVLLHLLLDFLTTGGIPLLYPFSLTKFSAEIYYYTDFITTLISLAVLVIIYLKIDLRYKKAVMIFFMIFLISCGGIRAYEKNNAINAFESDLDGNFTEITAYPTSDMFVWKVVLSDPQNQKYKLYEYHNLNGLKKFQGSYNNITITNGSYESGLKAIKKANNMDEVKMFRWESFYTCVNAQYQANKWKITYFDFTGGHFMPSNLTVYI